jgi:hypothetical protein
MRRLVLIALVLPLVACGTRHAAPRAPATPAHLLGTGAKVLYSGGDWAVVTMGRKAIAAHLVAGQWRADRSGVVKLDILAPHGNAAKTPQVAVEMKGPSHLVEEGIWVDGVELLEKGGGLKPENVTVYGAPAAPLTPGKHTAVAYGRTTAHGSAVAWTFTVV